MAAFTTDQAGYSGPSLRIHGLICQCVKDAVLSQRPSLDDHPKILVRTCDVQASIVTGRAFLQCLALDYVCEIVSADSILGHNDQAQYFPKW